MTNEQKKIFDEYTERLKVEEKRTNWPRHALKVLFEYLNTHGLEMLSLRIPEAQDFQTYIMTMVTTEGKTRFTKGTVAGIISCLTTFYTYLTREKLVFSNPFLHIKKVKRDKQLPKNILDEAQMVKLLEYFRQFWKGANLHDRKKLYRAHVISELMYSTGMRIHEVIALKAEDIDFDRGVVLVKDSKNKKEREGILNDYARQVLKLYVEKMRIHVIFGKNDGDISLLFASKTNLHNWLNKMLGSACSKLGFKPITSHHFRHAVGYHLLRAGCDMRFIQELLGHEELNTTQIYTKVDKSNLQGVLDRFHPRVFGGRQ